MSHLHDLQEQGPLQAKLRYLLETLQNKYPEVQRLAVALYDHGSDWVKTFVAVEDKDKGRVYRVILRLDRNEVNVDGRLASLSPGMTVMGEIKIRQKRIIEFFLDPFKKYQSEGLRER